MTIELEFTSKGEYCIKTNTPGRRWSIKDDTVIVDILKERNCTFEEATKILEKLKEDAKSKFNSTPNPSETLEEIIKEIDPFKHFMVVEARDTLIIWAKGDKRRLVGKFDCLTPKWLVPFLSEYEPDVEVRLNVLATYINPKNPHNVSFEDMLQTCINVLQLRSTLPRIQSKDPDIYPAVVEGNETVSMHKIPYKKKDVNFTDLNEYLQEFLLRVHNHKHLCALFWGTVTAKKWTYLAYLYGEFGREGKSSFIEMLGELCGSYANLTEDSRFALSSLYGASIIVVPENERARLLNSKTVMSITGGSPVKIEYKGKSAFTGKILGTIFVDSNIPPKIDMMDFETERLMYFEVSPNKIPKEKRLRPELYRELIGSTPNEFLNYCRQCCEELITEGELLKKADDHEEQMAKCADKVQVYEYAQILKALGLVFNKDLQIEEAELIVNAKKKSKEKFYQNSFTRYLQRFGVKIKDGIAYGVGKKLLTGEEE